MATKPTTVASYLANLPADRRAAIDAVRKVVLANLDPQYEEGMQYGMLGYYVPHRVFPAGYHCDPKQPVPFLAIGSQKNHMALYLMGLYCGRPDPDTGETKEAQKFRQAWQKTGKKLDLGKSCLRFRKLDDLNLDLIGKTIKSIPTHTFLKRYQEGMAGTASPRKQAATRSPATSKSAKPAPKAKSTTKRTAAKPKRTTTRR